MQPIRMLCWVCVFLVLSSISHAKEDTNTGHNCASNAGTNYRMGEGSSRRSGGMLHGFIAYMGADM